MPDPFPAQNVWKSLHTSEIQTDNKNCLFLMPRCNCSLHAFHWEMLKWLLKEGREGVQGVNQKYLGPDLSDAGEAGTGQNICGGRRRASPAPCLWITVHQEVPQELWRCSEDAALRTGCCIPHTWYQVPVLCCWSEGWKLKHLQTLLHINYMLCSSRIIKSQSISSPPQCAGTTLLL